MIVTKAQIVTKRARPDKNASVPSVRREWGVAVSYSDRHSNAST
jgi:hypothetical protein